MVTKSEHARIMEYWKNQIHKHSKKYAKVSGLDEACLNPERKFYVPHLQSTIKHIYEGKEVLNVDEVLCRIPREALVKVPQRDDLEVLPTSMPGAMIELIPQKITQLIDEMVPGDRSSKAVKVGGIMKHLGLSHNQRENVFSTMRRRGVDKSALNQARKYSQR